MIFTHPNQKEGKLGKLRNGRLEGEEIWEEVKEYRQAGRGIGVMEEWGKTEPPIRIRLSDFLCLLAPFTGAFEGEPEGLASGGEPPKARI